MPPSKRPQPPTAAAESVVSRMLAKLLGTHPADTVEAVCLNYGETVLPGKDHMSYLVSGIHGLYHWTADVTGELMSPRHTPLLETLVSTPDTLYLVKDTARAAEDSLWLAVADPNPRLRQALRSMPCRGLFHSLAIGDDVSYVAAIQLSTCLP